MANRFDEIGSLFLQRRKELGLSQEQLGNKVGVNKSEISKIENGRGVTFSTINKLSEALGVAAEIELKPIAPVSRDIIHYIVMCMGMFARRYNLNKKEACNYLSRFKGLKFSIDNYEAEHQLSLEECVDDMFEICKRNGGALTKNFEFLVEYITAKVVEQLMADEHCGLEEALLLFHNSETFAKLCRKETDMYVESPAYIYEVLQDELRKGTIRGIEP